MDNQICRISCIITSEKKISFSIFNFLALLALGRSTVSEHDQLDSCIRISILIPFAATPQKLCDPAFTAGRAAGSSPVV